MIGIAVIKVSLSVHHSEEGSSLFWDLNLALCVKIFLLKSKGKSRPAVTDIVELQTTFRDLRLTLTLPLQNRLRCYRLGCSVFLIMDMIIMEFIAHQARVVMIVRVFLDVQVKVVTMGMEYFVLHQKVDGLLFYKR